VLKILGDLKIILGSVENWATEYCIVVKVQKFCSSTDLTPWRILRLSHQGQQETGGGVCCLRLPGRYCVAAIQVSGTEYVEHGSPIQLMWSIVTRVAWSVHHPADVQRNWTTGPASQRGLENCDEHVCLSVYLSVCLSVYLSVCLSACLSPNPHARPSPHNVDWSTAMSMSVCLSVCPSVCLSVCLCPRAYHRNRTPGPCLTTWTGELQ